MAKLKEHQSKGWRLHHFIPNFYKSYLTFAREEEKLCVFNNQLLTIDEDALKESVGDKVLLINIRQILSL